MHGDNNSCGERWLSELLTILVYMPNRKYDLKIVTLLCVQMCVYTYKARNYLSEN